MEVMAIEIEKLDFNAVSFLADSCKAFVQTSHWTSHNGSTPCPSGIECWAAAYNTEDFDGFPPFAHSKSPTIIKIGGLFNHAGNVDIVQVENLAASLMAVNNINNKTNGIWADVLPHSLIIVAVEFSYGFGGAVAEILSHQQAFFSSGVVGLVGSLPNLETMAAHSMASASGLLQVHSMAYAVMEKMCIHVEQSKHWTDFTVWHEQDWTMSLTDHIPNPSPFLKWVADLERSTLTNACRSWRKCVVWNGFQNDEQKYMADVLPFES